MADFLEKQKQRRGKAGASSLAHRIEKFTGLEAATDTPFRQSSQGKLLLFTPFSDPTK